MATLSIKVPRWAKPLLASARYKGAFGGRGSGKSHFFAEYLISKHVESPNTSSICLRETQKSLAQSVKRLLEIKIDSLGVAKFFNIKKTCIESVQGNGLISFQGMQNHTAESIKSLENYDRAWVEEAQTLGARSLTILRPTLRKRGSELWFSWNARRNTDPVDKLLRGVHRPPNSITVGCTYQDNPWLSDTLREEMEYDKQHDSEKYRHVWLGEYLTHSSSRIFSNWKTEEFEAPPGTHFRFGADWGFAMDPTVLVRCFIQGRQIFIDHEAYMVGCDIIDIPTLFMTVPDAEKWPIVADSSRPETISYMRSHGFKRIMPCAKGPGSLEDGIEWLKSYEIVVHPRCKHTIDELTFYSYKTDKITEEVTPIIEDKHNHVIDSLRYACEAARRSAADKPVNVNPISSKTWW